MLQRFLYLFLLSGIGLCIHAQGLVCDSVEYFIENVKRGMFLEGGNEWGTHVSVGRHGIPWVLEPVGENRYKLNSFTSNGGDSHYLGKNEYIDADYVACDVNGAADGVFSVSYSQGDNVLYASAIGTHVQFGNMDTSNPLAQWRFHTRSDLRERMMAATADLPVDATFMIRAANFHRSNKRNGEWQGSVPKIGGDNTNFCAEFWSTSFDLYQDIEDLPDGAYLLSVQAFSYISDREDKVPAYLYVNGDSIPIPVITSGPGSLQEASSAFSANEYRIEMPVQVQGGKVRVGLRKSGAHTGDWVVFDNFELYYGGPDADARDIVLTEEEQEEQERPMPAQLSRLTDVSTLYINTFDGGGVSSKSTWKWATMWEVNDGDTLRYDSLRIRGRGNSTWNLAKKPYRLKFNEKEKLLGKGYANAKNWVLMANHADKTLIRNATASFIGKELGMPFNPGARFVDLVLNDSYIGSYQITDHVEIRKHRVDITEQDVAATDTSDVTGGYLIEADGFASGDPWNFRTRWGVPVSVKSPDEDIITEAQFDYIRNYLNHFESGLEEEVYQDSILGYRSMVDTLTLVHWILGTEFTANVDGYYSVYLYKERQDDRLYFGPMWDYDIAFNNCNRVGDVTRRLMLYDGFGAGVVGPWVKRMWQDPWMQTSLSREWQRAISHGIVENTLAYVDSMAMVVDKSQQLNSTKWPLDKHVYNEITLYSTYQEGVDYMKRFIEDHAQYLCEVLNVDPDLRVEEDEEKKDEEIGDEDGEKEDEDGEKDDEEPDVIGDMAEVEYRVAYDPTSQEIRVRQPRGQQSQGEIAIYTLQGRLVARCSITDVLYVGNLPSTGYVLKWNVGTHHRSVKFVKRKI